MREEWRDFSYDLAQKVAFPALMRSDGTATMTLTNPLFAGNARLNAAANNAPAMRRGESDETAVRLIQNALIGCGAATMRQSIRPDGTLDGDYGGETVRGVQRFQSMHGLVGEGRTGDGVVGRDTMQKLDEVAPRQPAQTNLTPGPTVTPPAETPTTARATGTVSLPTSAQMLEQYRRFRDVRGKPCQRDITNQCAIRMSVALMRCDIGFHFEGRIEYTHRGGGSCGVETPHNAGAQRLFDHMRTFWSFTDYRKGRNGLTADEIHQRVSGRPGIVFFKDCFTRAGSTKKVGDHIDYWDGSHTMNDLLNYNGPGERAADAGVDWGRWFEMSARDVYFLPL